MKNVVTKVKCIRWRLESRAGSKKGEARTQPSSQLIGKYAAQRQAVIALSRFTLDEI